MAASARLIPCVIGMGTSALSEITNPRLMLTHDRCSSIFHGATTGNDVMQLRKGTIKFLNFLTRPNTPKLTNAAYGMIEVEERIQVMQLLNPKERRELTLKLRSQSVQDFWTHEQELLKNGKCTRKWNEKQYESIMNISSETGIAGEIGGIAKDQEGRVYYGRHMMNPDSKPEYAGDWRNVQALTYIEYFEGVFKLKKNAPTSHAMSIL